MCIKTFRRTFQKVRRQVSKTSGLGFGFPVRAEELQQAICNELKRAHVPVTPSGMYLVDNWISRAQRLGHVPVAPARIHSWGATCRL